MFSEDMQRIDLQIGYLENSSELLRSSGSVPGDPGHHNMEEQDI